MIYDYKLYIFDLDGTIIDSEFSHYEAYNLQLTNSIMEDYDFIINKNILYGKEDSIDNNIIDYNELIQIVTTIRKFDNIMWKFLNKGRLIMYNFYDINTDLLSKDYIKHINKYLSIINKKILKISSCYSYNFDIFYIFKLYNLKRYTKYLILGTNPCDAECINYYNKSYKITYVELESIFILINESINNKIIENVKKKVKNINTTTFDKLNKYECIIFNIISSYITTFEEYSNLETMKNIELLNLKEFERAYTLLDNIELNGTLVLYTSTILTEQVLLILENIGLCFTNTFIYKAFNSSYKIIQWIVITFENFNGIKEKRTKNSQNFILSIKDFFNDNMKIYKTIINNYNFLSSVTTNAKLFEYIIDYNLLLEIISISPN